MAVKLQSRACGAGALMWTRGGPLQPVRPHVAPGVLLHRDQGAVPWTGLGRAGRGALGHGVVALHPRSWGSQPHPSPLPPASLAARVMDLWPRFPSTRVGLMEPPDLEHVFLLFPVGGGGDGAGRSRSCFPPPQSKQRGQRPGPASLWPEPACVWAGEEGLPAPEMSSGFSAALGGCGEGCPGQACVGFFGGLGRGLPCEACGR